MADSLAALPLAGRVRGRRESADIGSGAGFPGLPLAIARPGLRVDLVESERRKCAFLEDGRPRLGLDERGGGERARRGLGPRQRAGSATARCSFAPWRRCRRWSSTRLRCSRAGGVLIAWKGARDAGEEQAGAAAARAAGHGAGRGRARRSRIPAAAPTHLHLYEKVGPRRPGSRGVRGGRKRPLG